MLQKEMVQSGEITCNMPYIFAIERYHKYFSRKKHFCKVKVKHYTESQYNVVHPLGPMNDPTNFNFVHLTVCNS